MKFKGNKYYYSLWICLIVFAINIQGASTPTSSTSSTTSSSSTSALVTVRMPGHELHLNRQVLLQIPYFHILLNPEHIGKVYYNLDYDYAAVSDQFVMASLARKQILENVIKRAQSRDVVSVNISSAQFRYFILLYNILSQIVNKQIASMDNFIALLKKSKLVAPEQIHTFLEVVSVLFGPNAIANAFNTMEIEVLQEVLKPSASGDISAAFFSPASQMEWVILSLIKAERREIRLACFLLDNPAIVDALAKAQQRGVRIEIVLDQRSRTGLAQLNYAGLPRCVWPRERMDPLPLMHNKFFIFFRNIFDQAILVTGSANCTVSAQQDNEENIIVSNDKGLLVQFEQRFAYLRNTSQCYPPKKIPQTMASADVDFSRFFMQGNMLLQGLARLYAVYVSNGQALMKDVPAFIKPYVEKQWDLLFPQ